MRNGRHSIDQQLRRYEGLIFRTAQINAPLVEEDLEDIQQALRMKVWRALVTFDLRRRRRREDPQTAIDRYVFMAITDRVKDLRKKKRRGELSIEELTTTEIPHGRVYPGTGHDAFFERYLSTTAEETYAQVEDDQPLIPSTLNDVELQVLCLLYRDYKQSEVARHLAIEKRDVERHVRAIRAKMADWRPPADVEVPASQPETPVAA